MDTKPLGQSGVDVPEVGYGTWNYTGDPATIHRALELGSFLLDTAESYNTETHVGNAIKGNRDAYFVATKASAQHFRHRDLLNAAEGSLRRLGIGTIDLYQLHSPSATIPIDETMTAMDELVAAGKVRFVGVSNFSVDELRAAEQALGPGRIVENQIKYSLFDHGVRRPGDSLLRRERHQHPGVFVARAGPVRTGTLAAASARRRPRHGLRAGEQDGGAGAAQLGALHTQRRDDTAD